LLFRADS